MQGVRPDRGCAAHDGRCRRYASVNGRAGDTQGVADALRTALNMPLAERKARWKKLVEGVRRDDVTAWHESILERLYAAR